jgi:hypothetical protein
MATPTTRRTVGFVDRTHDLAGSEKSPGGPVPPNFDAADA